MTNGTRRGEGSASCPGCSLPQGNTWYPLYRRLGGPQGRSGQVRKISPPMGFDPRTVQPIASRYTDYATRPTSTPVHILYFPPGVQSFYPHKYMINYDSCGITDICQGQLEWNTTVRMEGEISCPIIPTIQEICVCGLLTSYDILPFRSSVATILRR